MKIKDFKAKWLVDIKDSEIQRNLIWSKEFKQSLIESILENKPICSITIFRETGKDYDEIIDGKQRIYAIESFWKGSISYEGNFFNEKLHPNFWSYEINIQTASGSFEEKIKLFNKINTNIKPLKPFELLRAKYYGNFIIGLQDFVKNNTDIKNVLKQSNIDRGDNEIIILNILKKDYSIDEYLKINIKNDFNMFQKLPKQIFSFINNLFKNHKNVSIEIIIAQTYLINKLELLNSKDKINEDLNHMLKTPHVEGWNKLSHYERIINRYIINKDSKRIFSNEIRKKLINKSKKPLTCQLCLQKLDLNNDIEIDHKIPWSKGGKTNIENAQLVHKYCNIKKSNN